MKNENQKTGKCDLNKIIALQEQTLIDQISKTRVRIVSLFNQLFETGTEK